MKKESMYAVNHLAERPKGMANTHLDNVAEVIRRARIDSETAFELMIAMRSFTDGRPTAYRNLMLVPGFKKLWEALEVMADFSYDPPTKEEESK